MMELRIKQKLTEVFAPDYLEVVNESHKHAGHSGDDGSGQTHFRAIVVSKSFAGFSRMERHRMVNDVVSKEFSDGLHALSLFLKTPDEYDGR